MVDFATRFRDASWVTTRNLIDFSIEVSMFSLDYILLP